MTKHVCIALAFFILPLFVQSSLAQADDSVESTRAPFVLQSGFAGCCSDELRPPSIACRVQTASWQSSTTTIQAHPGFEWRKTNDGWKQIQMGNVPVIHNLELPSYQPGIHPLNITAMLILLSLAAMAWGSSEWDWERFVNSHQ